MIHKVAVECPVFRSFRVDQVRGMFDLHPEEKARSEFTVEVPAADEDWQIGLIVGPSGSGKSTIARHAFPQLQEKPGEWPHDKAVVDAFPAHLSIKDVVAALSAVGFSSPPSWVKPYHVLSNGERFRCDLARAILSDSDVIAGSTTFRHTDVLERMSARVARKSTHGVFAAQSASTLVLASARAISAARPPIPLAQASVSR